jgi:predicted dehydrogenase
MSDKKFKTAIVGLNESASAILDIADHTGLYQIVAIGGGDAEMCKGFASKYQCNSYEDYRVMVVQNDLEVLLVAAPLFLCAEQVRTAMKRKCHIIKLMPPAMDFELTAELTLQARKESVRFVVANPTHFDPAFRDLRDFVASEGPESFHLITAACHVPMAVDIPSQRWLSDPRVAGGGVLLHNNYDLIDQIVQTIGVPQQVYSLNTNRAPDKQQRLSITEDTALLTLRYSDTLIGHLTSSRTFGPWQRYVRFHGDRSIVTASDNHFTVTDNDGKLLSEKNYPPSETERMNKLLKNVAMNILDPQQYPLFVDRDADLYAMAVIEAAYLSARTANPEAPSKILNMIKTEPTSLWSATANKLV